MSDDAATALVRAIREALPRGCGFRLERISSRAWASATFTGARHRLWFLLEGAGAAAAADRFLSDLEGREFMLRDHLVADIAPAGREDLAGSGDEARIRIGLEALTIETISI